jgi:hypothetical protein
MNNYDAAEERQEKSVRRRASGERESEEREKGENRRGLNILAIASIRNQVTRYGWGGGVARDGTKEKRYA